MPVSRSAEFPNDVHGEGWDQKVKRSQSLSAT